MNHFHRKHDMLLHFDSRAENNAVWHLSEEYPNQRSKRKGPTTSATFNTSTSDIETIDYANRYELVIIATEMSQGEFSSRKPNRYPELHFITLKPFLVLSTIIRLILAVIKLGNERDISQHLLHAQKRDSLGFSLKPKLSLFIIIY